jgi:hypothetical protein
VQVADESFVGITLAAAELVIEMSEDERRRRRRATQQEEGAEQGDAIGPAGDGNHHPRLLQVKPTQAALDLDDQRG